MMIVNQARGIIERALPEGEDVNIKALSEQMKVAYNTAYNLYHGRGNRIDYDTLEKFCALFDVTPGDVLVRVTSDT